MSFRPSTIALLAAGLAVSNAALAAGVAAPATAPAAATTPASRWTGFYAGVFGGYSSSHVKIDGCTGVCPHGPKLSGDLAGLQVGYDWERPNHVVTGIFGWLPLVRPKSPLISTGLGYTYSDELKQRFTAVAGARIGYAYDTWLPYAFAGVDYTDLQVDQGFGVTFDNNYVGLAAGAGVEHAVSQHASVDLRYMYTHLPSKTFDFGGGPEKYSVPSGSTLLAAVNYRF